MSDSVHRSVHRVGTPNRLSVGTPVLRTDGRTNARRILLTDQRIFQFRNARARIRNRGLTISADDLTPAERHDRIAWLKAEARRGADQLHAKAAFHKAQTLTNTETTAIARAKLDGRTNP